MFRTRFQTGDSDKTQDKLFTQNRDYVIIAEIKTATKRFLQIGFLLAHYSFFLIRLELKRRTP